MILKRAMKGELDLMGPAMAVQKELMAIPDFGNGESKLFDDETKAIANAKKVHFDGTAGTAVQKVHDDPRQRAGNSHAHRRYGHRHLYG
jgi:hypothetical protein